MFCLVVMTASSFSEEETYLSVLAELQGVLHAVIGEKQYTFLGDVYSMGFAAFTSRVSGLYEQCIFWGNCEESQELTLDSNI